VDRFSKLISVILVSGTIAGLLLFVVQRFTTFPLIEKAEVYESAAESMPGMRHDDEGWKPSEGIERTLLTALTSGLSPRTIRRHVDNLWSLGGEIIRDLHYDKSLRKLPPERLLRQSIHELGGPAIHNGSDDQQRSFDSTCRKLHRFLES